MFTVDVAMGGFTIVTWQLTCSGADCAASQMSSNLLLQIHVTPLWWALCESVFVPRRFNRRLLWLDLALPFALVLLWEIHYWTCDALSGRYVYGEFYLLCDFTS